MKQIRKELRQLKKEKTFLENKLRWAVNDLNFFHEFEQKDDEQKTINYLDISWVKYAEITEKIKALKHDLQNWKLVR